MAAARFIVEGRVQGVHYRAATRMRAQALGLTGSAVNRADGSVEVIAAGDPAALDALAEWLRAGPPLARVEVVSREPWQATVDAGFTTG